MSQRTWWRIGWRNLGRNRRRSAVTASALAVGYFSVVLMVGLLKGLVSEMIRCTARPTFPTRTYTQPSGDVRESM
jgi:hypothetical protein